MKKEIIKIESWSLARILGVAYGIIGLFVGLLLTGISFVSPEQNLSVSAQLLFGAGSIIFLPLLYGIAGFFLGSILAWVYNLFAKKIGGIVITFEDK